MSLDTTGLQRLDATGLKQLDIDGLTPLDTTGLTPVSPADDMLAGFDAVDIGGQAVRRETGRRDIDRIRSGFGSFAQGFGQIVSGLPKSMALLSAPDYRVIRNLDRIDRDRPVIPTGLSGPVGITPDPHESLYQRYRTGDANERQQIRADFYRSANEARQSSLYQAGVDIDKFIVDNFPSNPEFQEEFWSSKVPQALGSAGGFVLAGILGRGVLGAGPAGSYGVPATLGSQVNRVDQFEQALNAGSDIATALEASGYGAFIGTTEAVPIGNLFNRLDRVSGGQVRRWLVRAATQGTEEAVQESFAGIMNAAVAQRLYDPERGVWLTKEAALERGEEAAVGFTTGAILETLFTLALPSRRRGRGAAPTSDAVEEVKTEEIKTETEVREFVDDRIAELNTKADQTELTEAEAKELQFLRDYQGNPAVIGSAYDVSVRQSFEEAVEQEMDALTDEDRASPIPDELIAEGRAITEQAITDQEVTDEITREETQQTEAAQQETDDARAQEEAGRPAEPLQEGVLDTTGLTEIADTVTLEPGQAARAPESAATAREVPDIQPAEIPESVQERSDGVAEQAEINESLRERGQPIENRVDAERRWSNGETIFAFSEQDGEPSRVTSLEMLRNYQPDQLMALPDEEGGRDMRAPATQSTPELPDSEVSVAEPADDIETRFSAQPGEQTVESLEGFGVGQRVNVRDRTIGESTIEELWLRNMAGFDNPVAMAKVRNDAGKPLAVNVSLLEATTELRTAEAPLRIEEYTDKSIIIRGQTKENRDRIKAAISGVRALWNKRGQGWVFAKKREAEVREALSDLLAAPDAKEVPRGEPVSESLKATQDTENKGIKDVQTTQKLDQPARETPIDQALPATTDTSQNVTIEADREALGGLQEPIPESDARPGTEDVQPAAQDRGAERVREREVGRGARAVPAADRGRTEAAERASEGAIRDPGREDRARTTDRVPERGKTAERSAREDAGRVTGQNYRIEPGSLEESRGRVQKARDNIRAIELMRQIEAEGRTATAKEQRQLAQYVGWGGLKGAFPNTDGKYEKGFADVGKRLKELLSETEYATARRSLQYAHYTAENVVNTMWAAVERMGFRGGRVFEPGMGVGNFAGLMPADIAERTEYNGLELDHTTARIARLLYPHWGVRQDDFTKAPLPNDTFDLVIGNPPFADIPIKSDPTYPQGFLLHDYFFAKSMDAVRPGGLLAFITSAGTMNKQDTKAREYLADRADLVAAMRLPGTAFRETANTEVTTDILFFRKRLPDDQAGDRTWTDTVEVELLDKDDKPRRGIVNRYFNENRHMVLGEEGFFDKLYPGRYAVRTPKPMRNDAAHLKTALRFAMGHVPNNVMSPWVDPADRAEIDFSTAEHKDGSFYVGRDGQLMQQVDGVGQTVKRRGAGVKGGKTRAEIERIKGLVPVRDALRAVYAANLADDTANADKARARLNKAYDSFVEKFGPINRAKFQYRRPTIVQQESARAQTREEARYTGAEWREGSFDATRMIEQGATLSAIARARKQARERAGDQFDEGSFNPADMPDIIIDKRPNIDGFMDDPESYRLRAIEKYSDDNDSAEKGAVFFENIIAREREPEIKSVNDALLYVLNKRGRVEIDEIAHSADLSESEAIEQLGENIFRLPGTQDTWELRDAYLSGNVRRKLRQARAAAQRDPSLQRNVDALEAAQPAPLPPSEISANLGMPWIPTEVIEAFGTDELGLSGLNVRYLPVLAQWCVSGDSSSAAARTTWGTSDKSAPELIQDALNRQDPRVFREVRGPDGRRTRVLDTVATEAAQEKVKEIRERFSDWIWSDPGRAGELSDLYNEEYNSLVVREYDGSYLTTPGLSSAWSWRPHQTRVIARIIQDGNTYMAHGVGAGKTSAMIGAGMEMRRLGLVRKPMYAVPNHMLAQFTKEFYEQYPTARIAVADERRFHTSRRKQFIANVANEDLDAIIITHSAFGMIPVSEEFQDGLIQQQVDQYREILNEIDSDQENRITRSRLEKQIERLEQRLSGKSQRRVDQVFTFEEMGVDMLFVDEAHLFRKLDFATKMSNVKGISPEGSKASWDLYVKTRYLETINPGRNLVLASGTPVTNTMAELFTVSRYLQPDVLKERGLEHFDAWAGAFGDTVSGIEQNAAGGYQSVTRFAKFVNVPELSVMVRQTMDVVTGKQLDEFVTRPKLRGGKRQMFLAERDDMLVAYQDALAARMKAIERRTGQPQKGDDIILSIINDGRHAAIDMRLVNPDLPSNPGSKLNILVDEVYSEWEATKRQPFHTPTAEGYAGKPVDKGPATQLVFANLGLSGQRGFAVPDYIRSELVRRGVPKAQIAFIADFKTHVAKQRLFNDMNEGKVRILIGSTAKMATGVNVQKRLSAINNLDPLWYPADDEQRNGRGIRQGNMNPEIAIKDFSTKGTYDSTMWGMMERKQRFIQGFFEGDVNLRDMDDLGEASQYEQAKALTTADPRLIQLTELRQELERAWRRKKAFEREQYANRERVVQAEDRVRYYSDRIPAIEADIARRTDTGGDNFVATISGKRTDERVEAGDLLLGEIDLLAGETRDYRSHKVGEMGGFDIVVDTWTVAGEREAGVALARSGNHETEARLSQSSIGVIRSLEFVLNGFEDELANAKKRLADAQKRIEEFRPQTGKQFKGQAQIDELTGKVRELERALAPEPQKPEQDAEDQEQFALSDEFEMKLNDFGDDLRARLKEVGIADRIGLRFVDVIRDISGKAIPGARGKYFGRMIQIAIATPDKRKTLDHEIIHALRDLGLIRDAEWRMLKKAALADKPLMTMIRKRYKARKLSEEKLIEEAIAEMHAYWNAGTFRPKGLVRRAMERINDFFQTLKNVLNGQGFNSVGQIFRRISVGRVGKREPIVTGNFAEAFKDDPQFSLVPGDFDPKRAAKAIKFDNEESEKRWQEARKGIRGGDTVATQAANWMERIAQGFARHYQHLPNQPKFSEAREQLRKVEAAPQASKEEAIRTLRKIVADMDTKDVDLFTRKVVLDDLSYEVDQQHQLPFGFTPADVRRELAKVDKALSPTMRQRVLLRNRLISRVADEMVRSGVLSREQIKNPAYYRHQVLDYARAQVLRAKSPGQRLKSPQWARRMGSQLDINANLLEAEFEWMQKALTDIAVADALTWFKRSQYNQRDETIANAKASNQKLVDSLIARDMRENGYSKNGRMTSPLNQEWIAFKQRIAVGMGYVREAIDSGMDVPPEHRDAADSLLFEDVDTSIFPFLSWILDNDMPGSMGAAMIFKAVNQRKTWTKMMLGDQYADPIDIDGLIKRGFAPKDHVSWQPEEGRLLFTAKTIPEHVVDRMLDRIAEEDAGPISAKEMRAALDSVRSMLAVGGMKYQMVIPVELADTLNSLRDEHGDTFIDAVFAKPLMQWKRWVLINPRRVIKYNLNNLSGDADAVIAGNPRALRKVPRAIKELYQVMIRGKDPSTRYREAVDRGVFDSGLTIQEIPDINYISQFEKLINPPSPIRNPVRYVGHKLLDFWRAMQNFTWFRENWLRYAAYLDYVERIEAGESMRSIGYGAANRKMVEAVADNKDRAALLARELVGDYGAISHFGSHIRRKLIPFYSWMEINTKRYWRLGVNAWDQGVAQGFRTTGMIGATLGIRTTVWLTMRMAVLYGLVQAWNMLVMGDEHDELSAEERVRLHIILGRDDSGNVRTLRFQGALSDFLGWIGFEDAVGTAVEIEKGRATFGELMETIAKAPVNRIANGLTPLISAPIEAMSGRKYWPDVFRPRIIRDQWRNLAQLFSLEHEYDLIFDKPSRGYVGSLEQVATYKRNVDENAYNRIKGMTYDWLRREKGLKGQGGYVTPRSQALYEWRKAKRFGDRDAERKAYAKLAELGVSGVDLRASIRRAHPLGAVPLRDRKQFLASLTREERELLDRAVAWYKETYVD